jgi:hypothetical protein
MEINATSSTTTTSNVVGKVGTNKKFITNL